MCDDAKSNNHIRFRLNKKQECIIFRCEKICKLASSVNLYRFTHFLELSFGLFFANLLVGVTPNPSEHHLPMMATSKVADNIRREYLH